MQFSDFVNFVVDILFIILPFYLSGGKINSIILFSSGVGMFKLIRDLVTPSKIKELETRLDSLETRLDSLETKVEERLDTLETKVDKILEILSNK